MDGTNLAKLSPYQVARTEYVRTFQLTKALAKMSVLDNVKLGATNQNGERMLSADPPVHLALARGGHHHPRPRVLTRFKLEAKADDLAGSLSGGQRKLLEMARALMTEPKIVMLDEPMAGVNPALTQSLLEHVKSLRDEGMTVIFVEHDMDVIRDISDWVVVMAQGTVIAESPPDTLADNQVVVDAYLGSHHDQALEFDQDGNPVGETAVLAERIEQAVAEAIDAGGDLSAPIDRADTIEGRHRA